MSSAGSRYLKCLEQSITLLLRILDLNSCIDDSSIPNMIMDRDVQSRNQSMKRPAINRLTTLPTYLFSPLPYLDTYLPEYISLPYHFSNVAFEIEFYHRINKCWTPLMPLGAGREVGKLRRWGGLIP